MIKKSSSKYIENPTGDIYFFILGWAKEYPDNPLFQPSELLNKMVAEGKLGVKSGEGFYSYKK